VRRFKSPHLSFLDEHAEEFVRFGEESGNKFNKIELNRNSKKIKGNMK